MSRTRHHWASSHRTRCWRVRLRCRSLPRCSNRLSTDRAWNHHPEALCTPPLSGTPPPLLVTVVLLLITVGGLLRPAACAPETQERRLSYSVDAGRAASGVAVERHERTVGRTREGLQGARCIAVRVGERRGDCLDVSGLLRERLRGLLLSQRHARRVGQSRESTASRGCLLLECANCVLCSVQRGLAAVNSLESLRERDVLVDDGRERGRELGLVSLTRRSRGRRVILVDDEDGSDSQHCQCQARDRRDDGDTPRLRRWW